MNCRIEKLPERATECCDPAATCVIFLSLRLVTVLKNEQIKDLKKVNVGGSGRE